MEIWIATGTLKPLKKQFPFLRDFAVLDVTELASNLGYETTIGLNTYSNFLISKEVKNRLNVLNRSRRYYRVLLIVEEIRDDIEHDLLDFSDVFNLKYEKIYCLNNGEFELKKEVYK